MHFTSESSVFSIMAALIAEILLMLFFLCKLLCNIQNITEYKARWLMGFQIIKHALIILSFKATSACKLTVNRDTIKTKDGSLHLQIS